MGSKTTSQQNQSSSFSPPPDVLANYRSTVQQAQNVAATPYSAYSGPLVAGINPQQTTGIGAVNAASGIQNPANAAAMGFTGASAGAIDPTQFTPAQLAQYESPYQSDVINATEAEIQNQNEQQAAALQGNSITSGAFGGDRAGIAQAALAGQQDIASNATIAGLNNQNFAQALGEFNTQQGVNLGAEQNTAARQLAAGQQFGQLGQTAQTEALNEANAQTNAGTLEQTTQQAQDTAAYNQFLQQQAYPFETTGWLANIVEGIGSQSGGSSSGQSTTQGNSGSQIAGGLLGLASFLARGGRVPRRADGGAMQTPGGIYLPFDPTMGAPAGVGGGGIVPTNAPLAVGHTMPTQGAPAAPQAPSSAQNAQSMAQTAKAAQGAGIGIKDAYGKLTAPPPVGAPLTIDAAASAAPDAVGSLDAGSGGMAGLTDLGLGGIFARGGVVRPHFMGGGSLPAGFQVNAAPRPGMPTRAGIVPPAPTAPAAAPAPNPGIMHDPAAPPPGQLMHDPGPAAAPSSGPLMHDPAAPPAPAPVAPPSTTPAATPAPFTPSAPAQQLPSWMNPDWGATQALNGQGVFGGLFGGAPSNGVFSGQQWQKPQPWIGGGGGGGGGGGSPAAGGGAGTSSGVGTSGSPGGGSSSYARGGIARPHFMGGGAAGPGTFGYYGANNGDQPAMAPQPRQQSPTPVGNAKPAGAASYAVFPQQMSDGSWTTTQNLAQGIATPGYGGFARGGIVGRPHYDSGGDVQTGDPSFDLLPESLLLNTTAGAAQLAAPPMPQQAPPNYANQMPAPNVAQETQAAATGLAGQMPAPPMVDANTDVPTPPARPADLGVAPPVAAAPPQGIAAPRPTPYLAAPINTGPAPTQPVDPSQYDNTQAGHEAFIRAYAAQRGVDPNFAVSVARSEGLGALSPKNPNAASAVDIDPKTGKPFSFGDYQLNIRNGLGNLAMASGIDPKDPAQWQAADKFSIDYMAKNGLQPWKGDKAVQAYAANNGAPALAYDGGRTGAAGSPAAAAINAEAVPPGASPAGIVPAAPSMQTSAPQFPSNVPTPESGRTGLLGLNLSPETRQLMLSAGLGIMGAQGRSFLGNVGTGATAGIAAARSNANLSSEAALRNTQTQGAAIENQLKATQLKLMMDALTGHADAISTAASSATPPSPTTPTVTAPTVAGNAAAPPPKTIDPNFDPVALRALSDRLALGGPMLKDRADRAAQQAAAIMSGDQQVRFTDGTTGFYPGVAEAKTKQAEAVAAAQEAAKVPAALAQNAGQKTFDTQNTLKSAALKDAEDGQQMLSQATAMKDVMFDPKTGQPNVNSGPMGPHIATIAALLEQAGVSHNLVKTITGTNPDDAQALEKFRTNLGSESARADLPGSQVRVTEFQRYLQSVPSSEVLPAAFKYLIDNAIIPKAQQQIGAYKTIEDMDPSKDNIQKALFEYRQTNPWYKGPSASQPEPKTVPVGTPPGITPAMARAELARRAAQRQQAAGGT